MSNSEENNNVAVEFRLLVVFTSYEIIIITIIIFHYDLLDPECLPPLITPIFNLGLALNTQPCWSEISSRRMFP